MKPCSRRVSFFPSPRTRGEVKIENRSRDASASEFCIQTEDEAASARPFVEAHLKGGLPARMIPKSAVAVFGQDHAHKREAERRQAHPTMAVLCEARLRALRSPLASRRSVAALAKPVRANGSASGQASWDVEVRRCRHALLSQSRDSTSRAGRSASGRDT